MGTAFGLFFDKFKIYIVLALLAIMAAMVVYHLFEVGMLKSDLKAEHKRNGELVVKNSTLSTANQKAATDIKTQNTAIAELQRSSSEQDRLAKEEIAKVRKEGETWKGKYASVFQTPPAGKDDCANTFLLLDQYQAIRIDEALGVKP